MADSQQNKQGFELIPIPQEALGTEGTEQFYEVRRIWDQHDQCWYYSVIDFVGLLTQSTNPGVYWSALKKRNKQDVVCRISLRFPDEYLFSSWL